MGHLLKVGYELLAAERSAGSAVQTEQIGRLGSCSLLKKGAPVADHFQQTIVACGVSKPQ